MKANKIRSLIYAMVIAVTFGQCTYEAIPEPDAVTDVSFSTDIVPIFDANCNMSPCHNTGEIAPDLTAPNAWSSLQNGYLNLADPTASLLMTKIDGGSMETYVTSQDITYILQWIKEGAKDN